MASDDLPARVTALEVEVERMRTEVRTATADGKAARYLAARADEDLSTVHDELRAHRRAITALREDHVEFKQEMYAFRDVVMQKFAVVEAGVQTIIGLLDRPER